MGAMIFCYAELVQQERHDKIGRGTVLRKHHLTAFSWFEEGTREARATPSARGGEAWVARLPWSEEGKRGARATPLTRGGGARVVRLRAAREGVALVARKSKCCGGW